MPEEMSREEIEARLHELECRLAELQIESMQVQLERKRLGHAVRKMAPAKP